MRRLLLTLFAGTLALSACGDDGGTADGGEATTTSTPAVTTTITEVRPADTTFAADDVEALCADLEGLADIDPDADPTQPQVDRLLAIAETAPSGVAEPLQAVAAFGQLAVDGSGALPDDAEEIQTAAVEGATLLIAYGNEACAIDVPLFDAIAGV